MKVISKNPVIVDKVRVSPPDYYHSFVGDVTAFQKWANETHKAGLVVDGIAGQFTNTAYSKWGKEWEEIQNKLLADQKAEIAAKAIKDDIAKKAVSDADVKVSPAAPDAKKTKGFMETIKALSTTKKVLIGVGVLALIGGIVWGITAKNTKK